MKKIILSLGVLIFAASCEDSTSEVIISDKESSEQVTQRDLDNHASEFALDWAGVYSGVLPCADCPGIVTEISLYRDSTYELKTLYLGQGEEDAEFIEHGEFEWSEDGNHITLKNTEKSQYKIGENQIWALDSNGNVVMGDMEKLYILHKKN